MDAPSFVDAAPTVEPTRGAVEALPVRLELSGPAAEGVRRWVESVLGWQAVDADTAGIVPPRLVVADVAAGQGADGGLPRLLLVENEDDPLVAAEAARSAAAVAAWPGDRDRLPALAVALTASPSAGGATGPRELRVGGAAGGVGTTTVALALGGLAAWRGVGTLVVTHGAVPAPTDRTLRPEDLAGAGTWDTATHAPGLRGLRVVHVTRPPGDGPIDPGRAGLVVWDVGVGDDVDVLVVRRDRAGLAALERSGAAVTIVTDLGAVPDRALARAADRRRVIRLPWSARVARAGLSCRVPAGLPGRWLRELAPIVAGVTR